MSIPLSSVRNIDDRPPPYLSLDAPLDRALACNNAKDNLNDWLIEIMELTFQADFDQLKAITREYHTSAGIDTLEAPLDTILHNTSKEALMWISQIVKDLENQVRFVLANTMLQF